MFDYSEINPRIFEKIAQRYLMYKYPNYKWVLTSQSNDGNKDIFCKYQSLNQDFEYWAEAKFTKSQNAHALQKSQLDPTLLSALLCNRHVSVCFISNNVITDQYSFRIKDFKIKTNIGVELVLKETFEKWLLNNPNVLNEFGIKAVSTDERTLSDYCNILAVTITDSQNNQNYKLDLHLIEKNEYYLYLIVSSDKELENNKLNINGLTLLNRSYILDNPFNFKITRGKNVYKFEVFPEKPKEIDAEIEILNGDTKIASYLLSNLTILSNQELTLSYAKQEKYLTEILNYVEESNDHNFVISISGKGSTGKSKLLNNLYKEFNIRNNVTYLNFSENEHLNMKMFIQLLILCNIGDVLDFEKEALVQQLNLFDETEQKMYYSKLIDGYYKSQGECIKYLASKLLSNEFTFVYPNFTRVKQIIILDDVHKLNETLMNILKVFLGQFLKFKNNQILFLSYRKNYNGKNLDFNFLEKTWNKYYSLEGLAKEDKINSLRYYLKFNGDINFNRITDDVIVFSNLLKYNLEYRNINKKNITNYVGLIRSFENPKITNNSTYKEHLQQFSSYDEIINLIYFINFGISYDQLTQYFSYKDIDFLIKNSLIKRVGSNIFPFHDCYVSAYFEKNEISEHTINVLESICEKTESEEQEYLFLSLLIKSNYYVYSKIKTKAHELEYHYFNMTDYYKSYVLSKEITNYINFNEKLSYEELYDLFILAVSAGFFENPMEVKNRYSKVIKAGNQFFDNLPATGLVFHAKSEIINIDYWELNLSDIENKIENVLTQMPKLTSYSNDDLIYAYLNIINRKMVVKLLLENFEEAADLFETNFKINNSLNRLNYNGFLYMDYAKGLYNKNLTLALEYMEKAQEVFKNLDTEYRRLLDCNCEIEYLKCLISKDYNLDNLKIAMEALYTAKFYEIYSKAKLKLAALKIVRGGYLIDEIRNDIYISKYILSYDFTGRLSLLYNMVNNAFLIYSSYIDEIEELSEDEEKLITLLGETYKKVFEHNKTGIKTSVKFFDNKRFSPNYYIIDTRIW